VAELVDRDGEHLRLLSIFYYVSAGLHALSACFGILFIPMGVLFMSAFAQASPANRPPAFVGTLFMILGAVVFLVGLAYSALLALAGRFLSQRKHRMFSVVVAALNCLSFPYGTLLGVLTIMVLMRPGVQALFSPAVPPPLPIGPEGTS
jgi:hypothetical protein